MLKNSELGNYPTETLTEIERQRRFVLGKAMLPMPCPMCLKPVSLLDASGKVVDDYDLDNSADDEAATCPHCKTELRFILPFMGAPLWRRKHSIPTN